MQLQLQTQDTDLNEATSELQMAQGDNDSEGASRDASEISSATQQIGQLQKDIAQAMAEGCT
jgi:hypothetical protein